MVSAGIMMWLPTPTGDISTSAIVEPALLLETNIDFTTALVAAGTVKTVVETVLTSDVRVLL
jgi:hypothetical protein